MWKFLEDLKNDFEKGANAIADENESKAALDAAEEKALEAGKACIQNDAVIAAHDGVVEMVNQDQDEIEIYMDNGTGYGIRFPFGPAGYTVLVKPNEKVSKGQKLVEFGPELQNNVKVYSFTPQMIKVLSESRFRMK